MAARTVRVIFNNKTLFTLTKIKESLDHGEWTEPWHPPQKIMPGGTAEWRSESNALITGTGTEGSIKYQIGDSVNSLYIHWDNPFIGTNKYNESVTDGFELFHTGGSGDDTTVVFTLAPTVPHRVPHFLPGTTGFKWANSKNVLPDTPLLHIDVGVASIPIGNASNGLCGGMIYTVRDYYETEQEPPQDLNPLKGEGDPLFDYIVKRLFDSFDLPNGPMIYYKLMEPLYPDTDENILNPVGLAGGRAWVMAREEWPKIKSDIDSGHPSPIGLIQVKSLNPADLGENHQVLVNGYELSGSNVTLHIYDPNSPGNDNVTLSLNIQFTDKPIEVVRNPPGKKPIYCFFRTEYNQRNPIMGVPRGTSRYNFSIRQFMLTSGFDPRRGIRSLQPNVSIISLSSIVGL
jgi:hypothetical protein